MKKLICLLMGWVFWLGTPVLLGYANLSKFDWYTVETTYFYIHYHHFSERCAALAVRNIDRWFEQVNKVVGYPLKEKLHFVIRDDQPEANGEALSDSDRLEMFCSNLHSPFRGKLGGFATVFSHELAHILTLKQQSHRSELSTTFMLDGGYATPQNDHRFDFSLPHTDLSRSIWWTEGIAEYSANKAGVNNWTVSRDMFLRSAFSENMLRHYDEIGVILDKKGAIGEYVYNQGFDILRFVAETQGPKKVMAIAQANAQASSYDWDESVTRAIGISARELYANWQSHRKKKYLAFNRKIKPYEGHPYLLNYTKKDRQEIIQNRARPIGHHFIRQAKDKNKLAFVSDAWPYTLTILSASPAISAPAMRSAVNLNRLKKIKKREVENVSFSPPVFSPDAQKIIYSRVVEPYFDLEASQMIDLFVLDLRSGKETRLTFGQRATNPVLSPDGTVVYYSSCFDFSCAVYSHNIKTGHRRPFVNGTRSLEGLWIYHLDLAPDGKQLLLSGEQYENSVIAILDIKTKIIKIVLYDKFDHREAIFDRTPGSILLSSDIDGKVQNLYRMNLVTRQMTKLSNVLTGAFAPQIFDARFLLYSRYSAFGFVIYKLAPQLLSAFSPPAPGQLKSVNPLPLLKNRKSYSSFANNIEPLIILPRIGFKESAPFAGLKLEAKDYLHWHSFNLDLSLSESFSASLVYVYGRFWPRWQLSYVYSAYHMEDGQYLTSPTAETFYGYRRSSLYSNSGGVGVSFPVGDGRAVVLSTVYSQSDYLSFYSNWAPTEYHKGIESFLGYQDGRVSNMDIHPSDDHDIRIQVGVLNPLQTATGENFGLSFKWITSATKFLIAPWNDDHVWDLNITLAGYSKPVHSNHYFVYGASYFQDSKELNPLGYQGAGYEDGLLYGERFFSSSIAYRLPVFTRINRKLFIFYLTDVYLNFFASAGNVWFSTEKWFSRSQQAGVDFLKDAGVSLRVGSYVFNNFAWNGIIRFAYGFDKISGSRDLNHDKLSPMGEEVENDGQSLRIHMGFGAAF